ncbi:hypothetical protein P2318_34195 [Myxococcaceae bacterium GXIMD 01537]
MASCRLECAERGHALKGCMWLADIKYDWKAPTLPLQAQSRYAIWHCCCSYSPLSTTANLALRKQWNAQRGSLRQRWAEIFGEWPQSGGVNYPGHHIHDLSHGGAPTDLNNLLPVQPDIHKVLNEQYPICYEGGPPWNTVGPDLPYKDW